MTQRKTGRGLHQAAKRHVEQHGGSHQAAVQLLRRKREAAATAAAHDDLHARLPINGRGALVTEFVLACARDIRRRGVRRYAIDNEAALALLPSSGSAQQDVWFAEVVGVPFSFPVLRTSAGG